MEIVLVLNIVHGLFLPKVPCTPYETCIKPEPPVRHRFVRERRVEAFIRLNLSLNYHHTKLT